MLKWQSELVTYAEACRRNNPLPCVRDMSASEVGRLELLAMKIRSYAGPSGRMLRSGMDEAQVAIITSSPLGLTAAVAALGMPTKVVVYLTDSEFRYWLTQLPESRSAARGYIHHEWGLKVVAIDKQCERWEVDESHVGGYMDGHGFTEVWQWDGRVAKRDSESGFSWLS